MFGFRAHLLGDIVSRDIWPLAALFNAGIFFLTFPYLF